MIKFLASQPIDIVWEIDHFSFAAADLRGEKGADAEVPEEHKKRLISFLNKAFIFCESLSLSEAKNRIDLWKAFLKDTLKFVPPHQATRWKSYKVSDNLSNGIIRRGGVGTSDNKLLKASGFRRVKRNRFANANRPITKV
jgi:hypothetical protein